MGHAPLPSLLTPSSPLSLQVGDGKQVEVDVNDPDFWAKVMPDLKTPETLSKRFEELSATAENGETVRPATPTRLPSHLIPHSPAIPLCLFPLSFYSCGVSSPTWSPCACVWSTCTSAASAPPGTGTAPHSSASE